MTGLDFEVCTILEIASLVTTSALEVVAEGPSLIIHNSEAELTTLSEWSRETFGKSGLLEKVRQSTVSAADAEARTLAFLQEHVARGASPLCGNSVHNDRAFLYRRMRGLHDFLHYRNVDVSSIKDLVRRWYPAQYNPPRKQERHEALIDIRESVAELRYYRETFFVPAAAPPRP